MKKNLIVSYLSDLELHQAIGEIITCEISGVLPENSYVKKFADNYAEITGNDSSDYFPLIKISLLTEAAFRWHKSMEKTAPIDPQKREDKRYCGC